MKPLYLMTLKDKDSFKKLKDQIVIWSSMEVNNQLTEENRDTLSSHLLDQILHRRTNKGKIISKSGIDLRTMEREEPIVIEIIFTNPKAIDYILNDLNKLEGHWLSKVFDVKSNVIEARAEGDEFTYVFQVWDEGELEDIELYRAPKLDDRDGMRWMKDVEQFAISAGIPLKSKAPH